MFRRENRIRRRFIRRDGTTLLDEEVAHNRARVLYELHVPLPAPLEHTWTSSAADRRIGT